MKKITSITKEQEEQIPIFIKKWVDLASEKIDRTKAVQTVKEVFKEQNSLVIITESLDNTINLIRFCLGITGKKIGKLDSQLDSQLRSQLGNQLRSQLDSQLRSQLDSQLRNQLGNQLGESNWSWYVSYYWQLWAGYYDYGKSIGVEFDLSSLQKFYDIVLNMPICVFVGNVVFICEKPKVSWDEQGRLHSETTQAIRWEDGTGFYYLAGVHFEKKEWEKIISGKMSFSEILKFDNTEKRLLAMRYNPKALLKENPRTIDKSERGNELLLIENSEVNKIYDAPKVYLLGYTDPSKTAPNNKFYEEVDPELAEKHPDADFVNAEHCRLTVEEYKSLVFET